MVTYLGQRQLLQSIITDNYVVKTCNPKFDFRVLFVVFKCFCASVGAGTCNSKPLLKGPAYLYVISSTEVRFDVQFIKKLSNTQVE